MSPLSSLKVVSRSRLRQSCGRLLKQTTSYQKVEKGESIGFPKSAMKVSVQITVSKIVKVKISYLW